MSINDDNDYYILLDQGLKYLQNHFKVNKVTITSGIEICMNPPTDISDEDYNCCIYVTVSLILKFRSGLDDIDLNLVPKMIESLRLKIKN